MRVLALNRKFINFSSKTYHNLDAINKLENENHDTFNLVDNKRFNGNLLFVPNYRIYCKR